MCLLDRHAAAVASQAKSGPCAGQCCHARGCQTDGILYVCVRHPSRPVCCSTPLAINTTHRTEGVTFNAVIDRYLREKLPTRHSSASKYRSWLTHHIQPKWGSVPIRNVKPLLVEEWLSGLDLAPKSKGHIRSIMHILFNWAMKWELIDLDKMNPMKLVSVEGSSKRLRQPRTLTVKEFRLLLERLEESIRTMCIVAACLGLRASELAGLQWGDFDWGGRQVHIQRGFVIGYVDEVKTPNSNRSLPVHRALATLLLEYKKETAPHAQDTDWLFPSPYGTGRPGGHHPYLGPGRIFYNEGPASAA